MRRREFLRGTAIAAGAAAIGGWPAEASQAAPDAGGSRIKRVLVTFTCHLDVGFTDTQANVMRKYFDQYFPQAIQTAAAMRSLGQDHYVWTSGSWLLYEYLEQASAGERRSMEQAIAAGDVAWHALPFNWQTEMLDRSMIEGSLGFSASLDRRFGRKTIGAKMSDVPGHSRGIISSLHAGGVKLLDIGVNAASTPPEVPSTFVWKNPDGSSVVMLYHLHNYGGVVEIPGSDLAVDIEVRNDNSGPHSQEEIKAIYARLRQQFPGAAIMASNFSEVAAAVDTFRDKLPVVTQEIGDTWIYGVGSDPLKIARYREVARLRQEWIRQKHFTVGDATDLQLLRRLALAVEHTWGTDTKRYVDYDHYKPQDLAKVLGQPGYRTMERSWQEKRDDIDAGVASLPAALRKQAESRMSALRSVASPSDQGLQPQQATKEIGTAHFVVALDPKTGAITKLRSKKTGRDWAAPDRPVALFTYQTLSKADYGAFLRSYIIGTHSWAPRDFGKPNIEHFGAQSREWHPKLVSCSAGREKESYRLLAKLAIDDPASEARGTVAWPSSMFLELVLPDAEPVVHVRFLCFKKILNRMPESMWLTFDPEVPEPKNWMVDKVDQRVSPFDVVRGGNRSMHSVTSHVRYQDSRGVFQLATLDAPAVAVGKRSPIDFSKDLPAMRHGFHVNLFNNAWGTNYVQWAGGDWAYRFTIAAS